MDAMLYANVQEMLKVYYFHCLESHIMICSEAIDGWCGLFYYYFINNLRYPFHSYRKLFQQYHHMAFSCKDQCCMF